MIKYSFHPKLPKAPILRVRWTRRLPGQRFYIGMRCANFFECWIGPINILVRMPWLSGPARSLHPELFGVETVTDAREFEQLRSEIERLNGELKASADLFRIKRRLNRELRAQLAERDALLGAIASWTTETRDAVLEAFQDELNESASYEWYDAAIADLMNLVRALSASAEPSAPVERDELTDIPVNCRQRLALEGKPYPRSSCEVCGKFSPRWRECDASLERKP